MLKPITAIHYAGAGVFSEVTLDRQTTNGWREGLRNFIGSEQVTDMATPFTKPFNMLCDENGVSLQEPTALIVDEGENSGLGYLYGKTLFFRRAGRGLASVEGGDIERVKALPVWISFSELKRRDVPTAHQFTMSGNEFKPQLQLILTGPARQRLLFKNALLARFEHQITAFHVGPVYGADSLELMLHSAALTAVRKFIDDGLDDEGRFKEPWSSVR